MHLEWSPDPELQGCTLAAPTGRLDTEGVAGFFDGLAPRLGAESPFLLVDLGGVDWLSSAGVGALARLLKRAQSAGGTMAIFGCESRVRTVLRLCGLEAVFNVCDTAAEARARLRAHPRT